MRIKIDNQVIEINAGKTVVSVLHPKPYTTFKTKLDFDFNDFPDNVELVKKKNMAEYYWLAHLWNEFVKVRMGGLLSLNF